MYRAFGKRLLDLTLVVPALIIVSPILCLVAFLIRVKLGPPILFRQDRPGLREEIFTLHKFRTMSDARDARGNVLPDAERLSGLGRFLRQSSLDELPELFDVLRGKMSLVGPRPLLARYLERYSTEQRRRHAVKPGITGWAQVNGRNNLTWEQKFAFDIWYVDHYSLTVDITLLARTLWAVVRREAINQPGHATAQEFMG